MCHCDKSLLVEIIFFPPNEAASKKHFSSSKWLRHSLSLHLPTPPLFNKSEYLTCTGPCFLRGRKNNRGDNNCQHWSRIFIDVSKSVFPPTLLIFEESWVPYGIIQQNCEPPMKPGATQQLRAAWDPVGKTIRHSLCVSYSHSVCFLTSYREFWSSVITPELGSCWIISSVWWWGNLWLISPLNLLLAAYPLSVTLLLSLVWPPKNPTVIIGSIASIYSKIEVQKHHYNKKPNLSSIFRSVCNTQILTTFFFFLKSLTRDIESITTFVWILANY